MFGPEFEKKVDDLISNPLRVGYNEFFSSVESDAADVAYLATLFRVKTGTVKS